MGPRPNITTALLEAAREISQPRDLQTTLDTIVTSAAQSLPGIEHVGITIAGSDGSMETRASSDTFVTDLDELQYELGEGPCVHAITLEAVTTVNWASRDQRWPRFMPLAVAKGLRSQMGMRLYSEKDTLGGLNMYSTSSDTIDPDAVHMAELFAAHASLALGHARREEHLSTALATRKVIGQAIGILMERHAMDEDAAFAYLTRVSSHTNVKLRNVATEIVAQRNDLSKTLGQRSVSHRSDRRPQNREAAPNASF